jgi:crossover junction endodeoxyribonuclease RuvC
MEVRILGIDPGLQVCGYACLETNDETNALIEAGTIRTSGSEIEVKLNQIAEDMDSLLEKFRPEMVAVEQLYSHYVHPRTAILMGHARGVILQRCASAGVDVRSFNATRIKKSLTGNGRASKEQVILALPQLPEPPDVADAIAAALCCANDVNNILEINRPICGAGKLIAK